VGGNALVTCQPYLPDYDGTEPCAKTPVAIATGTDFSPAALAVGGGHACFVTDAGRIYCWGRNASGQLGNGTVEDSPVPSPLAATTRFATVSAGPGYHTCGIGTEGVLYCWGDNHYGQLGDDSGALSWPVPFVVWGW
jgi:alpha-tubulin suppressor-like RCC1 family protein